MSFYVFIFPVFFSLGFLLRHKLHLNVDKQVLILRNFLFAVCILLLVRDLTMMGIRAQHWDRDYKTNLFKIENNQFNLVGYNINYWPLGLGLDDVEKWAWINTAYVEWVQETRP
jgi:hypothetical protein